MDVHACTCFAPNVQFIFALKNPTTLLLVMAYILEDEDKLLRP